MAGPVLSFEPYLRKTDEPVTSREQQLVKHEWTAYLPNGSITYLAHTPGDSNEIIAKEWGDFFFGLRGFKSGWSRWEFLGISAGDGAKGFNIVRKYLPENVVIDNFENKSLVEFCWPLNAAGDASGKINLQILQIPSRPDWLFVKVSASGEKAGINGLVFQAYPGGAVEPAERERWAATKENSLMLNTNRMEFVPASPGIALFNKYVHEEGGDFLVYEPEKFTRVTIPMSTGGVHVHLSAKPQYNELKFALGYFIDKPAEQEIRMFFNEKMNEISEFMKTMEWNIPIDGALYDKLSAELRKLLDELEKSGDKNIASYKEQIDRLSSEYDNALRMKDNIKRQSVLAEMTEIKAALIKTALAEYNH